MTADAKVGLLLGLIFIVIIAFLINGLPEFIRAATTEEPVTTFVTESSRKSLIIGTPSERVVKAINTNPISRPLRQTEIPQERFRIDLPKATASVEPEKEAPKKILPKKKTYTVQSGDNLPVIAIKFYGKEIGNKHDTVRKLFEANNDTLESPDLVFVGQKLQIPPLEVIQGTNTSEAKLLETGMFTKVKSFITLPKPTRYRVKEDDTLWEIASRHLGDGNRYREIVRINKNIVNADDLEVGMEISLPER